MRIPSTSHLSLRPGVQHGLRLWQELRPSPSAEEITINEHAHMNAYANGEVLV